MARRIVVWGTCDVSKPRVRILINGLRANGVEVIECRRNVWTGITDKSQVKSAKRWLELLASMLLAYPVLLVRYALLGKHDCVLVCYPAFIDAVVIRPFAWMRGTPVVMDWFLSAYDTVVLDRKLIKHQSLLSRLLYRLEWMSIRSASLIFMDTRAHAERMELLFGLPAGKCGAVWVGVESERFKPPHVPSVPAPATVLFYGQFIPLHGIATIVSSAALLRNTPVRWIIVGSGQEQQNVDDLIAELGLSSVERIAWVDYDSLPEFLCSAAICLGIFGESEKAASVIPNKVFQILACGRPLITRDSPAMRELVNPEDPAVRLVPAKDPQALADAVLAWIAHPPGPGMDYQNAISPVAIGRQFQDFVRRLPP